jgi:hypothetical protein
MNPNDLQAKVDNLTRDLALVDEERTARALDAERGVPVAQRALSDLTVRRNQLLAAIDQAKLAVKAARVREEAEARQEALRRENEHVDTVARAAEAMRQDVAALDAAIVKIASLLTRIHAHRVEVSKGIGFGNSANGPLDTFAAEMAVNVNTALAGRGFRFKPKVFYTSDGFGPDGTTRAVLADVAMLPLLPDVEYFKAAARADYLRRHSRAA